jgi:hypothetical protein
MKTELKANEFRIGNFVEYDNRIFEIDVISDIYPTLNTPIFGIGVVDWNNIKPIPLTEELLLKFGFKKCDLGGFSIKTDKYEYIEFNSVLFCWVNGTKKPIKYVHQLQNLYFALTSEELTINF